MLDPLELAQDPTLFAFEGSALTVAHETGAPINACLVEEGDGSAFGRVVYLVVFDTVGQSEDFAKAYMPVDGVTAAGWGDRWAVAGEIDSVRAIVNQADGAIRLAKEQSADPGTAATDTSLNPTISSTSAATDTTSPVANESPPTGDQRPIDPSDIDFDKLRAHIAATIESEYGNTADAGGVTCPTVAGRESEVTVEESFECEVESADFTYSMVRVTPLGLGRYDLTVVSPPSGGD